MVKRIWIFRHAQSLSNAGGITLDPREIPLTALGRRQARDMAWSLPEPPQAVITSPFLRAIETGHPGIFGRVAMRRFTERQIAHPLANCERFELLLDGDALRLGGP